MLIQNTSSFIVCQMIQDSVCSRARRILALRHPRMLLMRCWAHQIDLMVKALLGDIVLDSYEEQEF